MVDRATQGRMSRMDEKHLPNSESIEELAVFWDTHDLTDFEEELEEVPEVVFERDK